MEFSERLETILKANGLTAKQLTEKLQIGGTSVTDWKRGRSTPSPKVLIRMAKVFNTSIDYLLTGETPPPKDLTPDQQELLALYDQLDDIKRAEVRGYLKAKTEKII